ncbi:MAG TPA: pyridoxal phosphate-dependent aminotransferase [Candidatus Hydrogenedentes bacterium]|nr:pyridoxal phosphate-dependent aminotransferase [Candidatus Hydrogenedentota bacterium]HNT89507.1 pyridoxal phosphate-dependent aminotransferase [Candidatus Hydrogenedentota bacterium]
MTNDVVDIGKGEPDFHTPEHIKRAGHAAIDQNFTKYTPQPGIPELREAIAWKFEVENGIHVSQQQVVVSCGGKHAVDNALRVLVRPGDEVLIVSPFWFAYPEQVRLCGGVPVPVVAREENGYLPDPAAVRGAVTSRSRVLIINSPNNPTGAVYPRDLLRDLAGIAVERDLAVLADEVYEKILFDGAEHVSIASLDSRIAARTVTVNSVSKTHAMTGWRIGYAALPGTLADRVTAVQSVTISAPSAISQRAALAAFNGDQDHVARMAQAYAERRRYVLERIDRMTALSTYPCLGTFYCLVSVSPLLGRAVNGVAIGNADVFAERLQREARVRVVSGVGFGAPKHIRISFAVGMDTLIEGLDRLEQFVTRCVME